MDLTSLSAQLGDNAEDLRANLKTIYDATLDIPESVVIGCALSCAYATKSAPLIAYFTQMAEASCSDDEIKTAKQAAIIMAQNNIYYRALGLISDETYEELPAKLRMNAVYNPPSERVVFEYFGMGVSAINGCEDCLNSHHEDLLELGWNHKQIQSAIRVAAMVFSAAQAIAIETN